MAANVVTLLQYTSAGDSPPTTLLLLLAAAFALLLDPRADLILHLRRSLRPRALKTVARYKKPDKICVRKFH